MGKAPEAVIRDRMQRMERRRERLQAVVDLRARELSWAEIADKVGDITRQRVQQMHAMALAEGLQPTQEET